MSFIIDWERMRDRLLEAEPRDTATLDARHALLMCEEYLRRKADLAQSQHSGDVWMISAEYEEKRANRYKEALKEMLDARNQDGTNKQIAIEHGLNALKEYP